MTRKSKPPRSHPSPVRSDRIRHIDGQSFAFIPHRFLRDGFFVSLTPAERSLYLLYVLAGDRNGVSFYHYDSICSLLEVTLESYLDVRNALIQKDLIAYDGTRTQVLSLPAQPVFTTRTALRDATELERHDPATIRARILDALSSDD
jgi:hypothetical protein